MKYEHIEVGVPRPFEQRPDDISPEPPPELSLNDEVFQEASFPVRPDPTALNCEAGEKVIQDDIQDVPLDAFNIYKRQLRNAHPLLDDAAREKELGRSIEVGVLAHDRLARADAAGEVLDPQLRRDLEQLKREGMRDKNILTEANILLVFSVASKYIGKGMPWNDLVQAGNLGLVKAVMKFDYTRDNKFGVHGVWWIRHEITRALSNLSRVIRLPVEVVARIQLTARTAGELKRELGREPTTAEIAKKMDLAPELIRNMDTHKDPISLDQPVVKESDSLLGDTIEDHRLDHDMDREAQIQHVLDEARAAHLTEVEQMALFLTQDLRDVSITEAAKILSLSLERTKTIVARALAKLAHPAARIAPALPVEQLSTGWRKQAACGPEDLSIFFSQIAKDRRRAESLCAGCMVRNACLIDAVNEKQQKGMRGGLSAGARQRLHPETLPEMLSRENRSQ